MQVEGQIRGKRRAVGAANHYEPLLDWLLDYVQVSRSLKLAIQFTMRGGGPQRGDYWCSGK